MDEMLHIRIKKDYAVNVINDLETIGAVELVTEEEARDIPQWQKDDVLKAKAHYELHPDELLTWDEVFNAAKKK